MKQQLLKEQLIFKEHYKWSEIPDKDPRISGDLADIQFDPSEGREVLYFINKLLSIWKFNVHRDARKIEKMIKIGLPKEVKSQFEAKTWIKEHWINY